MRKDPWSSGIVVAAVLAGSVVAGCQRPAPCPARDPVGPNLIATWSGHTGPVHGLAVSPDGAAVVSASDDTTLRIWRVGKCDTAVVLRGHADKVWAAVFTREGNEVVSAGFDACVKRWHVASGAELHSANGGANAQGAVCLALSADGRRLATGGFDSLVRLWELGASTPSATWQGHSDTVWAVAFAADGQRVYSGSFDGTIRVWDVAAGVCIATWTEAVPEARGWKRAFALAPAGDTLLCGGADSPREWDLATGRLQAPFASGRDTSVVALAVSADGRWLATGGLDGHLAIWDRTARTLLARWPAGQGDAVWAVAFLPDGQLLSAGDSGTIKQWCLAR